jgi:hypothetical protein
MLTVELKARDLRAANGKEATGQSRQDEVARHDREVKSFVSETPSVRV